MTIRHDDMNGISHKDTTAFVLPCVLSFVTARQRRFGEGDLRPSKRDDQQRLPTPFLFSLDEDGAPRARTRRGSAHLVRLLIDPRFDGEESPNPNPQERDSHHQRHHTQCLNARQLQPPHSRNTNNKKSHRGPDVRQQRTLVRQLSPLPSQPVSNSCIQSLGHGRSANPHRNDTPSESEAQQTGEKAGQRREGARGRGGQQ